MKYAVLAFTGALLVVTARGQAQQQPAIQQLPTTPPGALTSDEINRLVFGKTLSWLNEYQKPVSVKLNSDGRVEGSAVSADDGITFVYDGGTWRIADNKLCMQMTLWVNGRELCRGIIREGVTYRWSTSSKPLQIGQ